MESVKEYDKVKLFLVISKWRYVNVFSCILELQVTNGLTAVFEMDLARSYLKEQGVKSKGSNPQ
jgi:hypothetical protein